ncbi:MAG: hypothetical protein LUG23_02350 [Oscillospiraceae bacterium]|nr:hypothetical protein [Oscillospiraceae bacterium]
MKQNDLTETLLENTQPEAPVEKKATKEKKSFLGYQIKDIVFLAVMSAVILVTSAFMPLLLHIPLFGIIQIGLGLQFSMFPAIGLAKVRKPFSLVFMSVFSGVVLLFMNTVMFVCLLFCALIAEGVSLLIFRSYEKDAACFVACAVYFPLSLPFMYVWYQIMGGTVLSYVSSIWWVTALMSIAVVALCCLGSFLGVRISKELKKSGVMKK